MGKVGFLIDDEPLRRLKQEVAKRVGWVKRRAASVNNTMRALGLAPPRAWVTIVHVEESRPGEQGGRSRSYERVSFRDAVASSIMRRYGIEEAFLRRDRQDLR